MSLKRITDGRDNRFLGGPISVGHQVDDIFILNVETVACPFQEQGTGCLGGVNSGR